MNTDQKNSEYGQFSRNVSSIYKTALSPNLSFAEIENKMTGKRVIKQIIEIINRIKITLLIDRKLFFQHRKSLII